MIVNANLSRASQTHRNLCGIDIMVQVKRNFCDEIR